MALIAKRQFLIFDADDTLWENNIYFEAAFDQFCNFLAHSSMAPADVRAVLDEIEHVNSRIHGYGSRNFARNLAECYQHLSEREISDQDLKTVMDFAHAILERPMELIDGVAETVKELAGRHVLTLFTKGDPEEQRLKIDRSGLRDYFDHAAIVREKDESAYRKLSSERNFIAEDTWMIGNSPKSDIAPALKVGLNAVFVPHSRTWALELSALPEHPRLHTVKQIRELTEIF
jgi:putative hydrolase of the HAD superfamily